MRTFFGKGMASPDLVKTLQPTPLDSRQPSVFLTDQELEQLTSYRQPSKQRQALDELEIPYLSVRGRPVVPAAVFFQWQSSRRNNFGPTPNFAALSCAAQGAANG